MNKYKVYRRTFDSVVGDKPIKRENFSLEELRKAMFNGVMAVLTAPIEESTVNEIYEIRELFRKAHQVFIQLTPNEVQQVFPINKVYNGARYGVKDYFHTQQYLKSIDCNKPIGENIEDFIWEYLNSKLRRFLITNEKYENLWVKIDKMEVLQEVSKALDPIIDITSRLNKLQDNIQQYYSQISEYEAFLKNNIDELMKPNTSKNLIVILKNSVKKIGLIVNTEWHRHRFNKLVEKQDRILAEIYKTNEELLTMKDIDERIELLARVSRDGANGLIRRINSIKAEQEEIKTLIKI